VCLNVFQSQWHTMFTFHLSLVFFAVYISTFRDISKLSLFKRDHVHLRGTEAGHLADDGHQAPDERELSLTIFNGKKCKQTVEAQDRGFRGDPGSTGSSLKDPGQDQREPSSPSPES